MSASNATFSDKLAGVLETEHRVLTELLTLLENERAAIEARAGNQLEQTAELKEEALNAVADQQKRRCSILQDAGFPCDSEGLRQACESLGEEEESRLSALATAIAGRIEECKSQNEVNGHLLEGSRQATEAAITVLYETARNDRTGLYGPRGTHVAPDNKSGSIAKA